MDNLLNELKTAIEYASNKHRPIYSIHEGYAILLEEVDELWAEIKQQNPDLLLIRKEAFHVATIAIRLIYDVLEDN